MKKTIGFDKALVACEKGKRIQRSGWNGKNMFVFHRAEVSDATPNNGKTNCLAYLCMKTVDDKFVPWLASQTDILAKDWSILD